MKLEKQLLCVSLLAWMLFGCASQDSTRRETRGVAHSPSPEGGTGGTNNSNAAPSTSTANVPPQSSNQVTIVTCPEKVTPHIYSIGSQSVLVVEQDRPLRIPIEGYYLRASNVSLGLELSGTHPVSEDDFSFENPGGNTNKPIPDIVTLAIKPSYVNQLRTGDTLTVHMIVTKTGLDRSGNLVNKASAFASRTFSIYTRDDYQRLVIPQRIPVTDLRAFPLQDPDVRYLFGSLAARLYFVVKLTIINNSDQDKIVSSGLVTASGRAIVTVDIKDPESSSGKAPIFTVPVEVTPQSLQQVYQVLNDREASTGRSWTFRTVEFVGALASAVVASYGAPLDVLKGVDLFTGVGIPASKKLWPNSWPGYKLNVVTYGMPELMKIPAHSAAGHKFLFFPKEQIQTLISDPTLFVKIDGFRTWLGWTGAPFRETGSAGLRRGVKPPSVQVISLGFDNLSIPFENILSPAEGDVFLRLTDVRKRLKTEIAHLSELESNPKLAPNGDLAYVEPKLTIDQAASVLTNVKKALADSGRTNAIIFSEPLLLSLTNLQLITKAFTPAPLGWKKDMVSNPFHGLEALKQLDQEMELVAQSLTRGTDPNAYTQKLEEADKAIRESQNFSALYTEAASILAGSKPEDIGELATKPKPEEQDAAKKLVAQMVRLSNQRGDVPWLPGFQPMTN